MHTPPPALRRPLPSPATCPQVGDVLLGRRKRAEAAPRTFCSFAEIPPEALELVERWVLFACFLLLLFVSEVLVGKESRPRRYG